MPHSLSGALPCFAVCPKPARFPTLATNPQSSERRGRGRRVVGVEHGTGSHTNVVAVVDGLVFEAAVVPHDVARAPTTPAARMRLTVITTPTRRVTTDKEAPRRRHDR